MSEFFDEEKSFYDVRLFRKAAASAGDDGLKLLLGGCIDSDALFDSTVSAGT